MYRHSGENIRLMKAFEIQKNYQLHRKKLYSIQKQNARENAFKSAKKNVERINQYQRKRISTDRSRDLFRDKQLEQRNQCLHKTLSKVYNRNPHKGSTLERINSVNSMRSTPEIRRDIEAENARLLKCINNAKSRYTKYREDCSSGITSRISKKQQMIKLLQKQLGKKPHFFRAPLKQKKKTYKFRIHTLDK